MATQEATRITRMTDPAAESPLYQDYYPGIRRFEPIVCVVVAGSVCLLIWEILFNLTAGIASSG